MKTARVLIFATATLTLSAHPQLHGQSVANIELDADSDVVLTIPPVTKGPPRAGKRVLVTPPEYQGTQVYHSIYLPDAWTPNWKAKGCRLPIIFEYTGNRFPQSGSTGEVKDAGLGFGLSGGKYIWVSLPYISQDGQTNQLNWWGDVDRTIEYAKKNVPRILDEFGGDEDAVFLCGFSRGAIGVNYLGLHDDEIAKLWTAFITHDHFDGVRAWGGTDWGSPLEAYREQAAERLRRVGDRPYLVCQNGTGYGTEAFVQSVLPHMSNFSFCAIDAKEVFGTFPNPLAKAPHTDRWPLKPSRYRTTVWQWMNRVAAHGAKTD